MGVGSGAESQRGESYVAQASMKTYRCQSNLQLISLQCQEAVQAQEEEHNHEERKEHSLWLAQDGDYSCSYKSELKDPQWSCKTIRCLIFTEPENPISHDINDLASVAEHNYPYNKVYHGPS